MKAFDNAKRFFAACEASEGWEGCKKFVADGATFSAQSEPLVELHSVKAYCEWMAAFGTVTAPGSIYDLHTASFCGRNENRCFFRHLSRYAYGRRRTCAPDQPEDKHAVRLRPRNEFG